MEYIKTYEGFFDFFKRKVSEDDETALIYIKRLKRVKGICPYDIEFTPKNIDNNNLSVTNYRVLFDDTPIKIIKIFNSNGFCEDSIKLLTNRGASRKNKNLYYALLIECMEKKEKVFSL